MANILIVEDDEKIRRSIKRHLQRESHQVAEAKDGQAALEVLDEFQADVVLLDIIMPVMDGYEFCKRIRKSLRLKQLYILMLSAKASPENSNLGIKIGADDYLSKPFDPTELLKKIEKGLRTVEARKFANIDSLTNLYNRSYFNSVLEFEIARCHRTKSELSLVVADIDNLKQINEKIGNTSEVLKETAGIILHNSRTTDICVSWGGKEFVFLLTSTPVSGAAVYAERIRKLIEQNDFQNIGKATLSLGVSSYNQSEVEMFDQAGKALSKAKNKGGNKVEVN
jgi:diguanylate cyclase (GGDEF)-like protein